MNKKTSSVRNTSPADFSWAKDSGFTPPKQDGRAALHQTPAPASPQVNELNPLLKELLETLLVAVKADAGIIRILPPHGQVLQPVSSVGLTAKLLDAESHLDLPCETCGKAAIKHGIYIEDISSCEYRLECRYASCQFHSIIIAPLANDNAPVNPAGTLTLFFNKPQQPDNHTSKTVLSFARLISAIVEHNKSNQEAKRVDLMAERQAIGNEIHDSLAQTLVYTRMRTSLLLESMRTGNELMSAKYAHDIDDALESSQKTVRELITDFRCAMDPTGLHKALEKLTEQFCHRNEIALEYINRVAHLELPLEYEIQVFHIVQEALANIATHSGATHARLIVEFSGNYYVFTIKDNGSGGCTFTPVEGHYGMMIMRERAQRIGGEIKVESSKGFGTHVQLFFPKPGSDWRTVNE
jgi:two-component system nitrate/nitrite sensor histidine kinase NarX